MMTDIQSTNDVPFSEQLKRLRKERGLTHKGLRDATGVDTSLISRYENGLTPTARHLEIFANFFEVDFSRFTIFPWPDPIVNEITELVERLPQPKQVEVLEFARFKLKSLVA